MITLPKTALGFFSIATALFVITSCWWEEGDKDNYDRDPCDDIECKKHYERKVQTASTVCQCQCAPGFSGPDCTDFEDGNCEILLCKNGGEKIVYNEEDKYCYCECPPNFGGEECDIPLTTCAGIECPEGQAPNSENDCLCE